MYWHTNTVIFYSENSMPFFGGKKPSNDEVIELLLIKVQTMLCVTLCVHIYSTHMLKTQSTRTLFCKHNNPVYRIPTAHLPVH